MRSLLATLLSILALCAHADIWVTDKANLYRIDPLSGRRIVTIPAANTIGVAVDPRDGAVWVLSDTSLSKRSSDGSVTAAIDLKSVNMDGATLIALDGRDGSVWLCQGGGSLAGQSKNVLHVDAQGHTLQSMPSPGQARGVAVALDQTVWILGANALYNYTSAGSPLRSIDLNPPALGEAKSLQVDPVAASILVAAEKRLLRVNVGGNAPPIVDALPYSADALGGDPATTSFFALAAGSVYRMAAGGTLGPAVDLSVFGAVHPATVAFDPSSERLIVGDAAGLLVFDRTLATAARVALPNAVEHIGAAPFTITTAQLLLAPTVGARINDPSPTFQLKLVPSCSGHECSFGNSFYAGYSISALLDSQIASPFAPGADQGVFVFTPAARLADGTHTWVSRVTDGFGQASPALEASFTIDTVPPSFVLLQPPSPSVTNQTSITISGRLSEDGTLTADGAAVGLAPDHSFSFPRALSEGGNAIVLVATDLAGNHTTQTMSIRRDTIPPAPVAAASITFSTPSSGAYVVSAGPGSVEAGATVLITDVRTGAFAIATADASGAFSVTIAGSPGDVLTVVVTDAAGNASAQTPLTIPGISGGIPPDPSAFAPPIDATVASVPALGFAFIYSGPTAIQTGVVPGAIETKRAAMLRGTVLGANGQALPGAKVSILGHPEYGQTLSRADGGFDLAVNGGFALVAQFEKSGYLPAQRSVDSQWQQYVSVPEVVLTALDANVTSIASGSPTLQVAQGSVVSDRDGTRRATVLFPPATSATLTMADGSVVPIAALSVRATEFTVGDTGPKAMPGVLPSTSGYTYAVELSADEAIAAGATRIDFDKPLPVYVENFLGFPVGGTVPVGYYDRTAAAWVPSPNGRVVKVLAVQGGLAALDTDGDGVADDATKLGVLGITDEERRSLATLYSPGQTLWRVLVTHFTPWDCNWPYGPPSDATGPNQAPPRDSDDKDDCDCEGGSIIDVQNRALGERIEVAGTRFGLVYRSDRTPGRKHDRLEIPLSGATVPASLSQIDVTVTVAGRTTRQTFPALTGQRYTFDWNRLDAYGRPVEGAQRALIDIAYVYPAAYRTPAQLASAFAAFGTTVTAIRARSEIAIHQTWDMNIGSKRAPTADLGGWTLSTHHSYDPLGRVVYLGDGRALAADTLSSVITTIGGTGATGTSGDGGLATQATINFPFDIHVGPDGSVYFVDGDRIRRIDPNGIISTVVAGLGQPQSFAIGPNGDIYIADLNYYIVWKLDRFGRSSVVAGTGNRATTNPPDGAAATSVSLYNPRYVTVAPDSTVYIVDASWVRKIDPSGVLTTLGLGNFASLMVAPDGTLYAFDTSRIVRFNNDGSRTPIAGGGSSNAEGIAALQASVFLPWQMAMGADGSIYYVDGGNGRVRRVSPDGIVTSIAGSIGATAVGDGGLARQAAVIPRGVAIGPQGEVYITDSGNRRIRRVSAALPGFSAGDITIPSQDGRELYQFDASGRHLSTRDAKTGALHYAFAYSNGLLAQVVDGDGNVTRVERDASGKPLAIVAPFGQRTELTVDANGWLASVTSPASEQYLLQHTSDGLLTWIRDPRGNASTIQYDGDGLLLRDQDGAGGSWDFAATRDDTGRTITMTSAEGRSATYRIENLADGSERWTANMPDGTTSKLVRGANGVNVETLANGAVVTTTYGPDPRLGLAARIAKTLTIRQPSGLTFSTATQLAANVTDSNNPLSLTQEALTATLNGRSFVSTYDATTRRISTRSPEGRLTTLGLDANGRTVFWQVPGVAPVSLGFDSHGRVGALTQGTGADARQLSYVYDTNGFVQSITDGEGRTASYTTDAVGRLKSATLQGNNLATFDFDANGNLAAVTPAGRPAHGFGYTAGDLRERYSPPPAGLALAQTTYAYNRDGQLTQTNLPDGVTVVYGHDPQGRLNAITPTGRGAPVTFGYDSVTGLVNSLSNADVGLAYAYDGFLVKQEQYSGRAGGTVSRAYDTDFRVSQVAVNGAAVSFVYDGDSQLKQAGALTIARDPTNGLIQTTTLGSVTTGHNYNAFGEPTISTARFASIPLYSSSLTVDRLGRIKAGTETVLGNAGTVEYGYDSAGRLGTVTRNGVLQHRYGYDANGNLASRDGVVIAQYDDQDRLTAFDGTSFIYGANGELASRQAAVGLTSYAYDVYGSLQKVTLPDSTVVDYLNDGRGRRVARAVGGTRTHAFVYEDQLRIAAELDATGAVRTQFVYATRRNVPEYMIRGGATYRIITDYLGSVRLVVDVASGTIAQRIDYDEWGRVLADSSPGFQPFGFAGGLYDPATGLVRFGARDYDASVGRWTAKDPTRFDGSDASLYVYAHDDPVSFVDVDGENQAAALRTAWVLGLRIGEFLNPFVQPMLARAIDSITGLDHALNEDASQQKCPPRPSSKSLRDKWEKEHDKPWPKDPKDPNKNQDIAHKTARADGGSDEVKNYDPKPHDEHMREHMENGDFSRWGARRNR